MHELQSPFVHYILVQHVPTLHTLKKMNAKKVLETMTRGGETKMCEYLQCISYAIENYVYAVRNRESLSKKNPFQPTGHFTHDEKCTHGYEKNIRTMTTKI